MYCIEKQNTYFEKANYFNIIEENAYDKNIRNADTAIGDIYVSHMDLYCCYGYKLMSIILFFIFKFIKQYINN